jgi:RNA polymerase primary sigma factor
MRHEVGVESGLFASESRGNPIAYNMAKLVLAGNGDASIDQETGLIPVSEISNLLSDNNIENDELNQPFVQPELPHKKAESPRPSYMARSELITTFLLRYNTRREVREALLDYRLEEQAKVFDPDPYRQYMKQILNYPLLKRDDEIRLFKALDSGVEVFSSVGNDRKVSKKSERDLIESVIAYNKIYYSNLRLVINATQSKFRKQSTSSIDQLDYIQEVNIALGDAIKRFNVDKGFRFSTYATWWLKQKSQHIQNTQGRDFKIPSRVQVDFTQILATKNELYDELSRDPSIKELAERLGKEEGEVEQLIVSCTRDVGSLYAILQDDTGREIADVVESTSGIEPFIDNLITKDLVETAIKKANLSREEELVLSLRYHIYFDSLANESFSVDGESRTYTEIYSSLDSLMPVGFKRISALVGLPYALLNDREIMGLNKLRPFIGE